ncbi:hypothetical protein RFM99_17205 [Mesorhizobium sp. VK4C]|uniref:hypothetical protein n=1 Tax=Mesorhizobium captivum TaxID=3072319 RepID=UPI002A240123|nr:hypothetical protein [Mesorhizobium sp. VK4C]MDX8500149.1 hypothetical protein [Mesorhizobium sp. VK4C]
MSTDTQQSIEDQRRRGLAQREAAMREWMRDHELQQEARSELIKLRVSEFAEEINRGVDPETAARRMLADLGVKGVAE